MNNALAEKVNKMLDESLSGIAQDASRGFLKMREAEKLVLAIPETEKDGLYESFFKQYLRRVKNIETILVLDYGYELD